MYKGLQNLSLRLNVKLKAKLVTYVTNLALNLKSGQKPHFNYPKASIMYFSLFQIKLQKLKNNSKSAVFTKVQLPENDFSDKFVLKTTFLINLS